MTFKTTANKVFSLILPLLASIPTFIFIFNLIFPSLEIFKVPRLFHGEIGVAIILFAFILFKYLFYFDLYIISPYLSYIFFKSLRNKTSLPRNFWLINIFFLMPLLMIFFFFFIFQYPLILIAIENPFYKLFYGLLLFLIGISCATNLFKNKKLPITFILIFTILYFLNGFTYSYLKEVEFKFMYYYLYFLFFAEIFLFKQLRNKPYLQRDS